MYPDGAGVCISTEADGLDEIATEEVKRMKNWTSWWKAAGIRAIKTFSQTAAATIGTSAVMGDVNWLMVASAALLAGILSLLTSVAGLPELDQ